MSKETKKEALLKHQALITKIGYPDKWEDYSKLNLNINKSFLENVILCNKFEFDKEIKNYIKKQIHRMGYGSTRNKC